MKKYSVLLLLLLLLLLVAFVLGDHDGLSEPDYSDHTLAGYIPPFSRLLVVGREGRDVQVLQELLFRGTSQNRSGVYDMPTKNAVIAFQKKEGLSPDGEAGIQTLSKVLSVLGPDNYIWNGKVPQGALFLIHVPVSPNRSLVHNATLYDGNGTARFHFLTRACGQSWSGGLLNMFSHSGMTPTGLMKADLNTKEDDPYSYGPYPVVRAVTGVEGNAEWLLPQLRNGILLHTGEWPLIHGSPPCSHGCVHTLLPMMKQIDSILMSSLGVVAHKNVGGKVPYPYPTQGFIAVDVINQKKK